MGAPVDMPRASNMAGIVKQHVFVRLDDPDPLVIEMFFQPIGLDQRFWMRVFSWLRSHREISAGPRTGQGISRRVTARTSEFRRAHASGVLAIAFCDREL